MNPPTWEQTLRRLDPATRTLDDGQRRRAEQTLARVAEGTDRASAEPSRTPPLPDRRRRGRLVLAGAALATAAVVAIPLLSGGEEAFASWGPVPERIAGAERSALARDCLALHTGLLPSSEPGAPQVDPDAGTRTVLAERRGGWTYVTLTTRDLDGTPLAATCLSPDTGSGASSDLAGSGMWFGSFGDVVPGAEPTASGVQEEAAGSGTLDEGLFSYAEGSVGADVAGLRLTTAGGLEIEASVEHGRYAAWWPSRGSDPDHPELSDEPAPTYEVTLRDGRVREVDPHSGAF